MSVLVVTEQQAGSWHRMTWEAVAAGQQIAKSLNKKVVAVALGSDIASLAEEAAGKRLDEVIAVDHELLRTYTPDGYTIALREVLQQINPHLVLFPHTYQVRDFGPKLSASLDRPFVSDVVALRQENGDLIFERQFFQGKLHGDVVVEGEEPYFCSVQSGAFRADAVEEGESAAPVRTMDVSLTPEAIRTRAQEPFRESKGGVDLSAASIIVSVGRGIKDPENVRLAEELARALGAELGASRPICDNGWLPLDRQIGSSGQTVSPKLYIALGISGAIQHVVGMKGSKTVVAINKDPSAPIFEVADYGIVGDLFEIVPALTEAIQEASKR